MWIPFLFFFVFLVLWWFLTWFDHRCKTNWKHKTKTRRKYLSLFKTFIKKFCLYYDLIFYHSLMVYNLTSIFFLWLEAYTILVEFLCTLCYFPIACCYKLGKDIFLAILSHILFPNCFKVFTWKMPCPSLKSLIFPIKFE